MRALLILLLLATAAHAEGIVAIDETVSPPKVGVATDIPLDDAQKLAIERCGSANCKVVRTFLKECLAAYQNVIPQMTVYGSASSLSAAEGTARSGCMTVGNQ